MKRKVKITGKRQITIPAEVFDELGLEVGQFLSLEEDRGELRLSSEMESGESTVLESLKSLADSPEGRMGRDHDEILAEEAGGSV